MSGSHFKKVGFVGSGVPMNANQLALFRKILSRLDGRIANTPVPSIFGGPINEFHHGCAYGSEQQAHRVVVKHFPWLTIHFHPPDRRSLYKIPNVAKMIKERRTYKIWAGESSCSRYCSIGKAVDILIVAPGPNDNVTALATGRNPWYFAVAEAKRHKSALYVLPRARVRKAKRIKPLAEYLDSTQGGRR